MAERIVNSEGLNWTARWRADIEQTPKRISGASKRVSALVDLPIQSDEVTVIEEGRKKCLVFTASPENIQEASQELRAILAELNVREGQSLTIELNRAPNMQKDDFEVAFIPQKALSDQAGLTFGSWGGFTLVNPNRSQGERQMQWEAFYRPDIQIANTLSHMGYGIVREAISIGTHAPITEYRASSHPYLAEIYEATAQFLEMTLLGKLKESQQPGIQIEGNTSI